MAITLYYAPFACSLSDHIALKLSKLEYNLVKVDTKTKQTEHGEDFRKINPTGAVPAIKLDNGTVITQNAAILTYIGAVSKHSSLYFEDPIKQAQLVEAIAFDGDLHSGVGSHIFGGADDSNLKRRLGELEAKLPDEGYLLGTSEPSSADIYAAVVLNWTTMKQYDLSPWPKSNALYKKIFASEIAQAAIKEETS